MTAWWRSALLSMIVCLLASATAVAAGPLEGEWIGGFEGRGGPVFVRVLIGGEGDKMAGRIDIPVRGERAILLERVRGGENRLEFEVPGATGNLLFEGVVKGDGRVRGTVRQGNGGAAFELMRVRSAVLGPLEGTWETDAGEILLLYTSAFGPAYVNYATGRVGRLFATSPTRFVAGASMLTGWPVDMTVDVTGDLRAPALVLAPAGKPSTRARRVERLRTERVRYASGGINIGATLVTPAGVGPFPAVVMIHGSGPVTRDALYPAGVAFALAGVAALVPDKRGVGESTGSWTRATFAELADDALAGVAFLRNRTDIDVRRIGLQGASQGGWVAPLAASRSGDVAFVVVEAAPAISPAVHERLRVERQMTADGMPRLAVAKAVAFMDRKFEVGRTGEGWERLEEMMQEGQREGWLAYTNPPTSLESLQWHWREVLSYDPAPALQRLRVPVLALYGELDTIVATSANRARLEELLATAGNDHLTVKVLAGANHNFFRAETGGPAEALQLRGFVPEYFDARSAWLHRVLDRALATPAATTAAAEGESTSLPTAPPADLVPRGFVM